MVVCGQCQKEFKVTQQLPDKLLMKCPGCGFKVVVVTQPSGMPTKVTGDLKGMPKFQPRVLS